jgi:cytochrome c oxidase subunit 4
MATPHNNHPPAHGAHASVLPAGVGDSAHHHGHTIVSASTLMAVLLTLFFFTLLTVGASQAELIISRMFDWHIPPLVNVAVALSIAVIKTSLVVLFFMQLKYDNPINAMIFIFCIITVAFFLGFTMIDLGNRETIDRFKGETLVAGGTGLTGGGPITKTAHEAMIQNKTQSKFPPPHSSNHALPRSSAQMSRPITGPTLDQPPAEEHAAPTGH